MKNEINIWSIKNKKNKFLQIKYFLILLALLLIVFAIYFQILNKINLLTIQFQTTNPSPTINPEEVKKVKKEKYVQNILSSMTLEEKIGQMIMWGINEPVLSSESASMIEDTHAGGVIIMINKDQVFTPQQINKLTHQIKYLNNKIPLFIAIDGEIGIIKSKISGFENYNQFPEYMDDSKFCSEVSDISNFLYDNGINVNFGIIADIGWNQGFIKYRTYGNTPESVRNRITTAIDCSNNNLLITVKHFPGHGRTVVDSHYTSPIIETDYDKWLKTDKVPFQEAIDKKVDLVMMGHLIYNKIASEPASLSLVHNNNVRQMGFDGIIITDDLGMLESSGIEPKEVLNKAINAKNDILLYVNHRLDANEIINQIVNEVEIHNISVNRINESVQQILKSKYSIID
ncbi:MAG: anhydromuramoyl-peptide exo-beta-N-acetylglucosaminidase, beta-N-acetylhexosaminidase [Candidatus Gottesmanbacteria bacterium GW2011_GWA2_43_14]|uniref:beta-N-acetylhexosaminidase n=1 Tax=Candidatus Gottesmanbacteria bacterium GW2011_GWA2_43_14 TaxID=1618443 RepID=A0A0G1FTE9_9BACT|nr:MAG: anhydromuramoyl-peptide exo-beta-N-acetylglucosaminidase, beta-N-acetylhexosaminidase [Candidatus Gottesmanbacteria bacterium GW2011_GWA2_43_14]